MNLRRALLVALVGVALTAGCGDDSGSTAAEPEACAFSPGDSATRPKPTRRFQNGTNGSPAGSSTYTCTTSALSTAPVL